MLARLVFWLLNYLLRHDKAYLYLEWFPGVGNNMRPFAHFYAQGSRGAVFLMRRKADTHWNVGT